MTDTVTKQENLNQCETNFTAYDFLSLFSTSLAHQNSFGFKQGNLINFINECKNNGRHEQLLANIEIKDTDLGLYSDTLNEAISELRNRGVLFIISNDENPTIYIWKKLLIIEKIKPKFDYYDEMLNFLESFSSFEEEKVTNYYNQLFSPEHEKLAPTRKMQKILK